MKNPQFIELYLILTSHQRLGFKRYLASPFFNTKPKLGIYLEKIDLWLKLDVSELKQLLFQFIYPNEEYEDVKLRLLFSEFLKHLKNYVYIDEKQSLDLERELSFIRFLRKGKQINQFESLANSFRQQLLDKNKKWNPDLFELRYKVDMELLSYESAKNRFSFLNFGESSEFLEISSLLKRLRIYLEQLSHESIGATTLKYPMVQNWVDYAETNNWTKYPEVKIYLLALKMYQKPDEEAYFDEYLQLIQIHEPDFDFERGREIYLNALNYCIRKINQNSTSYFYKTLDLFQHCVKTGWLLDYGVMSTLTYKNIISLCIRIKDLDLAIKLLEDYKHLVTPSDRNTMYHFNLAKIYKEQGEYQKALYLLNTSIFRDPLIELNVRVEMIKIYYETKENQIMQHQIQATRSLIKRSIKLGYHREYYSNFLNMANRLVVAKQITNTDKEKWLATIKADNRLIDKTWLFKMVEKMKASKY